MAPRQSTQKRLIPAAGYLRRSTSKQEKSLADQKREIERYAAQHGYSVVQWYQDDGISGDATEKRAGFQAMLRDVQEKRAFDAILVWDQDRFGRFNSLEAGYWIHPLVRAGVCLVSVSEGPINWTDFTGRIMYAMKQEGKHQFLLDLSRNVTRGQIANAEKGFLCGQAAPYGYDRMLVDEQGQHRQRIRTGEQYTKPRAWRVTLVPSDDPEKVATAKWLFETYANTDIGLRAMAEELNNRGAAGPGGKTWWIGTIREILRNEAYTGDFVWAKRRIGKYNRVSAGEIKERSQAERKADGEAQTRRNSEAEWMVTRDAHPALVDRETFARVQSKLAGRKQNNTTRRSKHGDNYLLTGLLFCAHCGGKMYGNRQTVKKDGREYSYAKYLCSSYQTQGGSVCNCHKVEQDGLLAVLVNKLREAVLAGGNREELRERIRARLVARTKADPAQADGLRRKLADLDRDVEQGTKRLLRAPDDVADLLASELSKLRRERERLAADLADLEAQQPTDVEAEADQITDQVWTLADELQNAEPARLRELVRRMVDRIELWWDKVPSSKKRVTFPLSKGAIHLRPDPLFIKVVSRGDRI